MATQQNISYPVFDRNQLLTNGQLNGLTAYLDEQNRLTRTALIGIGIVCGFKLKVENGEGASRVLHISSGVGVTSDGYLLTSGDCVLKRVMKYNSDSFGGYLPFQSDDEEEVQDVKLLELLSEDFDAEDAEEEDELRLLSQTDLEDSVVLLYLERFDMNQKSCLSKGCDETGTERKLNLRRLLISKADAARVLDRTGNEDMQRYPARYGLDDITLKRPDFGEPFDRFGTLEELGMPYRDAVKNDHTDSIKRITEVWSAGWKAFEPVLKSSYPENPFSDADEKIERYLEQFADRGYFGVQYFYDFLQDLVLTWKEFREVSFRLLTECLPDRALFPRHLFLGEPESGCVPSAWRQPFIQTPVYSSQKELLEETRMLFTRAHNLIKQFDMGITEPGAFELKITPSPVVDRSLSHAPVPYYYGNPEQPDGIGTLISGWSHADTKRCLNGASVLSYARNGEGDEASEVSRPLEFNRSDFGFYRIEGALGHPCSDAIEEIRRLVRSHNLTFDVQAVRISDSVSPLTPGSSEEINYAKGFHDLHEDYAAVRAELAEWLSSGIDVFRLHIEIERAKDQEDYFTRGYTHYVEESRYSSDLEDLEEIERITEKVVKYLCETLPVCVREFADRFEELQKGYADALVFVARKLMNDLVRSSDHMDMGKETEENLKRNQRIVAKLNKMAHQVLEMLFYNRLYRIYYAWRRREYFLGVGKMGAHRTLEEFLEQHPGLEHRAGATEGGTFVMVYGEYEDHGQRVLADFMLPYRCCGTEVPIPVCDDEHAIAGIKIKPYARPVFTFTHREQPVKINLLRFVRDIHKTETNHCDQDDAAGLRIVSVLPATDEYEEDIRLREDGTVIILPPKDSADILKYRYKVEKGANGHTDTGTILIAILEGCIHLENFVLELDIGESVDENNVVDLSVNHEGFNFRSFDVDQQSRPVALRYGGSRAYVNLVEGLQNPFVINYTATDGNTIGCGTITVIYRPRESVTVRGRVTYGPREVNLPNVTVSIAGTNESTTTNDGGLFEFTGLKAAEGMLEFYINGNLVHTEEIAGRTFVPVHLTADEPEEQPGIELLSPGSMSTILQGRGIRNPGTGNQLVQRFIASVSQQPISAGELQNITLSKDTLYGMRDQLGIELGDYPAQAREINLAVQRANPNRPVRPDTDTGTPGPSRPVRDFVINPAEITRHADDFTIPEIHTLLRARDVDFTTDENKDELVEKLKPAIRKKPVSGDEIKKVSENTVSRLKKDVLRDRAEKINNADFRKMLRTRKK